MMFKGSLKGFLRDRGRPFLMLFKGIGKGLQKGFLKERVSYPCLRRFKGCLKVFVLRRLLIC